MTKCTTCHDNNRRVTVTGQVCGYLRCIVKFLMVSRFQYRGKTALNKRAWINQVLGGAWSVIGSNVVYQRTPIIIKKSCTAERIACLEQPGYFHCHNTIIAAERMTMPHGCSSCFIHRPANSNHILNLRQAFINNLSTRSSGIPIYRMNSTPYTAGCKRDISL